MENVKAKSQTKGLQITWKQQADASSYTVYIQKDGKWQTAGSAQKNTLKIKNLKPGKKYQVKVTASNEKGSGKESKILYTAAKPLKPKVKSVRDYKKTGLKIVCKKSGETGFEVWVKQGKNAYKKAASGSKTVLVKKGIRTGKKVSVRIRGYVKNKGTKVYSAYRKVKF